MSQTTQLDARETVKAAARQAVREADPWGGFFEDLSFGGDAFPEESLLKLIDEADVVYWEVRPGIECDSELLIVECGEWRGRFGIPLPRPTA